jgi:hypothetical protein
MLPAMYFKGCFIYDNAYEGILLQLIFENIFEKFRPVLVGEKSQNANPSFLRNFDF